MNESIDRQRMLAWGVPQLRDLPWRRTRDPWHVLVSEVMLQQTQVRRVLPKWEAFVLRWPTPEACANESLGEVLREWQGLGYPRRARSLHAAAGEITRLGRFPDDLSGLLALPGVGHYTARALLAFAFEHDAAVVDTNIARVIARVAGRSLTARVVQTTADEWLIPGESWAWNQSLMDLGAVLCRPTPNCAPCPLLSECVWSLSGYAEPDPARGSAGVSVAQSPFEGSDRQARGRLLRRLGERSVSVDSLADVMHVDEARARRLLGSLQSDGLVAVDAGTVTLPTEVRG